MADQVSALEIYIQYDDLLAEQLSAIIQGTSRAYDAIQQNALGHPDNKFYYPVPRFGRPLLERLTPRGYPPLAIVSAETGRSIRIGMGPAFDIRVADGAVDLTLPRSRAVAAIILVGAALTVGLGAYDKFLDVQKKQLEVEKLRREVAAMAELTPRAVRSVRYQVGVVRDALDYPTIRSAEINGVPVR